MSQNSMKTVAVAGVLSLLLASCGADNDDSRTEEPTATETVTGASSPSSTTTESTPADPEDSEGEIEANDGSGSGDSDSEETEPAPTPGGIPSGGTDQVADEDLPGTMGMTLYREGTEYGVIGLDREDAPLDVFAVPNVDGDAEKVGELRGTEAFISTGRYRTSEDQAPDGEFGVWIEVELADGYGWMNGMAAPFAHQDDITEDYIHEVPAAEDPMAIVDGVAQRYADEITIEELREIAVVSLPEDFDENFYRVDVTGVAGHGYQGDRLRITVTNTGNGYELEEVLKTRFCEFDVTEEGLCL